MSSAVSYSAGSKPMFWLMQTSAGWRKAAKSSMASSGASTEMFVNPNVSLSNALHAVLVVMLAGALAGLLPARRAVAVSTVEALRSE